jgi:hypothetical protein
MIRVRARKAANPNATPISVKLIPPPNHHPQHIGVRRLVIERSAN